MVFTTVTGFKIELKIELARRSSVVLAWHPLTT
jgi:hypothetical protein